MASGISVMLCLQTVVNIGVVVSLLGAHLMYKLKWV